MGVDLNRLKNRNFQVVMLGCFDTKAADFEFLYTCLIGKGISVITINTGTMACAELFPIDFSASKVAANAGTDLATLRKANDRGKALELMGAGAEKIVAGLVGQNKVDGIIGMGGGGGTFLALKAMGTVPFGIPKVCLSTLATKDLSKKIGSKDVVLIPSIVDVSGLNAISRVLIGQAAGALYGMMETIIDQGEGYKGSIALSVFGNTAVAADTCTALLKGHGYDVLSFHAVGSGGASMEALCADGVFTAVIDLTITELADELCSGICSAGPDRLTAAGKAGLPQVVVPGCLDMVNFGPIATVPKKYKNRQLFSWAPDVTLMRTNLKENKILGKLVADKINAAKGPVTVLLPLGGISKISGLGEAFHDPEADTVLFNAIKENADKKIKIVEVDANINTAAFAEEAVAALLELMSP